MMITMMYNVDDNMLMIMYNVNDTDSDKNVNDKRGLMLDLYKQCEY